MFPSYIQNPKNCHFEGQDPDEKILLLLRAHPITRFPTMILAIFLFFTPFIVLRFLPIIGFDIKFLPESFLIIFLIIDYLLVLIVLFEGFLYWYFNATVITDNKVVDFVFEPVLYKGVNLAPLTKIEETDSKTSGIFGTAFNFGNVTIQTAGARVAIEMHNIPNPATVADLILDLTKANKQNAD